MHRWIRITRIKNFQPIEEQEIQQNRWKAIHFLLNRGAFGVGYNIPDGLSPSGHVYYTSERREGVSIMDLVEEKDDFFIDSKFIHTCFKAGSGEDNANTLGRRNNGRD